MADGTVDVAVACVKNINFPVNESSINEITQALRVLRNHCSKGNTAQNYVTQDHSILTTVKCLLDSLGDSSSPYERLCFNVALQFLANSLVNNKDNQNIIWEIFKWDFFNKCLEACDFKTQNCTAMILYNILINNEDILLSINSNLTHIVNLTQNEQPSEYALFILELFLCKTNYISTHYESLSHNNKMVILDIIEGIDSFCKQGDVTCSTVSYLAKYFVQKCPCIVGVASNEMEASDAHEVAKLLEVINSVSSLNTDCTVQLQMVKDLLIAGVGLLRTVHSLSKEKGNEFSMLLKMADLEADSSHSIQDHPGFGFKAALVRLVGNMCWHNREHQDTARELGAIPLILDCCNIDARNPLIIQWAVLAMRNLCENNLDNQRVVASVDQKGEVDRGRLAELGLLFNGGSS